MAAYRTLVIIATDVAPSDAITAHRERLDFRILRKLDDEVKDKWSLFHRDHLLSYVTITEVKRTDGTLI